MSVRLRVIFGRHGISCANVREKTQRLPGYHTLYPDPELSYQGRVHAKRLGTLFQTKLRLTSENPVVCASGLLRAQQTAYEMTRAPTVFVVPHICETGAFIQTADNTPLSSEKQDAVLLETCHKYLIPKLNRSFYRTNDLSNFNKFKEWFAQNWSALSTGDSSRLFVFFSHGRFIRSFLKKITGNNEFPKLKNYECHELTFEVNTATNTMSNVRYVGRFDYGEGELPSVDPDAECGHDTCRFDACLKSTRVGVPAGERCKYFGVGIRRSNNTPDPRHLINIPAPNLSAPAPAPVSAPNLSAPAPAPNISRRRKRYNRRKTRKQ